MIYGDSRWDQIPRPIEIDDSHPHHKNRYKTYNDLGSSPQNDLLQLEKSRPQDMLLCRDMAQHAKVHESTPSNRLINIKVILSPSGPFPPRWRWCRGVPISMWRRRAEVSLSGLKRGVVRRDFCMSNWKGKHSASSCSGPITSLLDEAILPRLCYQAATCIMPRWPADR